jgi:CheY-like chemotaxis protein/anti-sigma regulatory factor (Ser/Thr protein kinase)
VIRPSAEARGVALEQVFEAMPLLMIGDSDRLQQAVWNLLSNAVKFSDRGGRIEARVWRGERSVHFTVRDTGRGIDPRFLPHVFDRFRQADSSYTREHGGLGLGLSIVRAIVELHGGTVTAASSGPGRGATFQVMVPADAAADPGQSGDTTHPATDEAERLDGIRIVVVDDQPDERRLVATILEHRGAQVATAESADAAIRSVEEWAPDVVVSDIAMPGEDGYVLVRRLRDLGGAARDLPVVALTAHARAEDRERAMAAGFQAYLPKPVEPSRLVRAIVEQLRRHSRAPRAD